MNKLPAVVAISGVKNSGKTTFIAKMLPLFNEMGIKTAVIKHDGHRFEADPIETDTGKYMNAGACGTAVFDGEKYKIIRKERINERKLMESFLDVNLMLLEGFKYSSWPKIELVRAGNSAGPVSDKKTMLALATDLPLKISEIPVVHLNDIQGAVDIIVRYMEKGENMYV